MRHRPYLVAALLASCLSLGFNIPCRAGELGELLRAALDNPAVAASRSLAEAADSQTKAAQGRYFGQATLSYGRHHYDGPRVVGYYAPGTSPPPLLANTVDVAGFSYVLPLDFFGQVSASVAKAQGEADAAQLSLRRQQLAKLHQTLGAYYTLYALERRREAMDAYRNWVQAVVKRLDTEVKLGRSAPVQARYAQSQLSRLQSDEIQLVGDIATTQAGLNEATGRADFMPRAARVPIPAWRDVATDDTLDAKSARAREASAQAAAREARAALLPQLALDAGYSHNAAPDGPHRENWGYGATLTLPLGVSALRQADVARANTMAAQDATRSALRVAESTLKTLRSQYEAGVSDIAALKKEVNYREELVKVEREMQKLGNQTLENLFRHEDDLLEACTRLALARARVASAWSGMEMLAGVEPSAYITALEAGTEDRKGNTP
jgi:outer membrane protein TolC